MKDIITRKDSSSSLMSFTYQTTEKQNSLKVYNILRYKLLRHILSYSSFPLTDIYKISQFRFDNFINMPNHDDVIYKPNNENRIRYKFTTLCVECQNVQKCGINAKCCKFLKTYFALFVLSDERYYYKKRQFKFVDVI